MREKDLVRLIKESIIKKLNEENEPKLDKYGNPIPKYGQGWGKTDPNDPFMRNRQGYEADGSKGPWFSRSAACATAVFLHEANTGEWFVLAAERGTGAADYNGYWNLPCGYLDYNENTMECAIRETYEETGIKLNRSQMREIYHSSDVNQNRQNICFFYAAVISGSIEDFPFSKANMEENEVGGIQWVPIGEIDNVMWAFDHDELLKMAIAKLDINDTGNFYDYKAIIQNVIADLYKPHPNRGEIIKKLQNVLNGMH